MPELYAMKGTAGLRLQVTGNIVAGSIRHDAVAVNFLVGQGTQILQISMLVRTLRIRWLPALQR